ncbi:lytic transglycosylase domain-containing protein [Trinickia acidisoli]|uniref:lytic transglycosylase domain-containing protein n=1 Tax=Trinickia acidisoli TaxID=2767482 RepID=UPI002852F03A|nr:lytic transglycosylase domain-containing protein [Trinickia acidisoli]
MSYSANLRSMAKRPTRAMALALCSGLLACSPLTSHADCLDDAANYWGIPPTLARAIATYESGMRADAVGRNKNGTRDIGLMQINSSWLLRLSRYGIKERDLFNACINAYVGNWILASNIAQLGLNWNAVGAFNAATPAKREAYARSIYRTLLGIQSSPSRLLR